MGKLTALILAAGKSTRMKSAHSKVLSSLAGRPVLAYPIEAARDAGAAPIKVVVSPDQADIREYLKGVGVGHVVQREALGTAHAVMAAANALKNFAGDVLILCGDVPLVRAGALKDFVAAVRARKSTLGVLTMTPDDAGSYGRIVRDLDGRITRIVEAKDATDKEISIREVNSGILLADRQWLFNSLKKVKNDNAKGEYYITDLVGIALKEGVGVSAHKSEPACDFHGINTRVDLARAAELMRERINKGLQLAGAGLVDFRHTYVDAGVRIGRDSTVLPFSFIQGDTRIGRDCTIENGVVIRNATIGNGVHIKAHSVIEDSTVSDGAVLGPFARVRPGSKVGEGARIGNFVELKKCTVKKGAKANHLTYLGDAVVGAGANIGGGTITCRSMGLHSFVLILCDGRYVRDPRDGRGPSALDREQLLAGGLDHAPIDRMFTFLQALFSHFHRPGPMFDGLVVAPGSPAGVA